MTDHNPHLESSQALWGKQKTPLIIFDSEISSYSRHMDWSSNYLFGFLKYY